MKQFSYILSLAAICISIITSCAQAEKFDKAAARAAIEAQEAKYAAAFNAQDYAAVAALHTEDCTVLPPNRNMIKGRQAVAQMTEEDVKMGARNLQLQTVDVSGAGHLAYEIGTYTADIHPEGQEPFQDTGKYLVVWQQQSDGTWLISADIWNSSMPMPGM